MNAFGKLMKGFGVAAIGCLLISTASAQQNSVPPASNGNKAGDAAFLRAADEVLAEMSHILSLKILTPLKKSVRSRQEIHDYLVDGMKEDKDQAKRDADTKTMVALGLIPKGYPLEQKILSLLTEQIAGLYDPKRGEFFIADWTDPGDQRVIMAHELTHALQDQHFHIDKWQEAVKSNDDASLARETVLEGSATVAMVDYLLHASGKSVRDLGGFDFSSLMGDPKDSPEIANAPMVLRDEMLFPYVSGSNFMMRMLKEWNGWTGMKMIFERPPKSTQQILHPDLYIKNVSPVEVALPDFSKILPADWKELDRNLLGEFGLQEALKQFLGPQRAVALAPGWAGDKYAILESAQTGKDLLVIRIAFRSDADAARYFGGYSDVLEMKDGQREHLMRRPNFFSFDTPDGGVFLRCFGSQCLSAEGTTREAFDAITRAINWPAGPADPSLGKKPGILARAPQAPRAGNHVHAMLQVH